VVPNPGINPNNQYIPPVPPFPNNTPAPVVPVYTTRFNTPAEAIAFAQANGQGPLTVAADGTTTNRNGERMVFDSSGNLAPAPMTPMAPVAPVYVPPVNNPMPNPAPVLPVYPTRFNTPAEAIAFAQANGQGPLTVAADGSTTNRFGEKMVFDSSGNLAPAPRTEPLVVNPMPNPAPVLPVNPGSFNNPADAVAYAIANGQGPMTPAAAVAYAIANGQGQLKVGADGVITNSNGQKMVFDASGNITPGTTFNPMPTPAPVLPVYPSRFNTPAEAIAFAQANGQGPLTVAADGTTTNRFGEKMVFDSSGNLAPAPRTEPLVVNPMPAPAPALPVYPSRFKTTEEAIAYAQANGQGQLTVAADGTTTNRFGEKMVFDSSGNLAPAPRTEPLVVNPMPAPAPVLPVYPSRFKTSEEAIAYAQANGQGTLTVAADGTTTNRFGEKMVFDSSGNLAPMSGPPVINPMPVLPVYPSRFKTPEEAIAYAQTNGQGTLTVAADGSTTNRFGQKMVFDSDGNLAPGPMFDPLPVLPVHTSRFKTPEEAIAHAQANGQGQMTVSASNGMITNRNGEKMVFDSSGNLVPQPVSNLFKGATTSSISGLAPAELKNLYSQVGDAMYAPGFNYSAHIAANTAGGVFKAPAYMPADTSKLIPMPVAGSTAYQSLLAETGGASANPDFNYAAHIAATTSKYRPDLSQDDVMRLIRETGRSDVMNIDLAAHRQSTGSMVGMGNYYVNPVAAKVGAALIENSVSLKLPPVGSAAYKALSESTGGASEKGSFNYAAHVAATTSQTVLKTLSYSEVMTLIATTGKSDFSNFDVMSYQAEKASADLMISRLVADPVKSNIILPAAGSAEYQNIQKETGLKDLSATDYAAYLSAKHVSNLAVSTLQGSETDDVIVANPADKKNIFVLGQGNDSVTATDSPDIMIGGAGNDILDGGKGLDKAVFSGDSKSYKLTLNKDGTVVVADTNTSRDGVDQLKGVERISFTDTSLAFDIAGNAGASYRLYKAAFGRQPDSVGLGYWMKNLDKGADLAKDVASGFINSKEFQSLYGENTSNATFIANLYQNVLNRTPDAEGYAYWDKTLASGANRANILTNFSDSNENIDQVSSLVANGIAYTEYVG
jgi:hypothetical protein